MSADLESYSKNRYRAYALHWLEQIVHDLHLMPLFHKIQGFFEGRTKAARPIDNVIPQVIAAIPVVEEATSPATWIVQSVAKSVSDVTVMVMGPNQRMLNAVVKLATTEPGRLSLLKRASIMERIQADARFGDLRGQIPVMLAKGEAGGHAFLVERMVNGTEASKLIHDPRQRKLVSITAASWLVDLQRRTAVPVSVDEEMLTRWVYNPCAVMQYWLAHSSSVVHRDLEARIARLRTELQSQFAGKTIQLGWVHGDFTPSNLFVSPDGSAIVGVIDWESASPQGIARLDLLWFFLSIRMQVERCELGDVMQKLLGGDTLLPYESFLLQEALSDEFDTEFDLRTLLLLSWLHHVYGNLTKSERYARNRFWMIRNVESVLVAATSGSDHSHPERLH